MTANRIENPRQAIYRSLEATSNPALRAAKPPNRPASRDAPGFRFAQPRLQEDHNGGASEKGSPIACAASVEYASLKPDWSAGVGAPMLARTDSLATIAE